jgi:hypothetical protein
MLLVPRQGRWRHHPAPFFFLLGLYGLFNNYAHGQAVQRLSVEELAKESDVIVRAQVQNVNSQQTKNGSGIVTRIEISILEQWKGATTSSVVVSQPGGTAGAITQAVPGLPQFSIGEEIIIFLRQIKNDGFETVGGRQGKFLVKTDPDTRNASIQDVAGNKESLASFVDRLRAALK